MTIIEPHKQKSKIIALIVLLLVLGGVFGAYAILLNASIVNLAHTIEENEAAVAELQVRQSELQNELYAMLDPEVLEAQAKEKGLVLDAKPRYLETGSTIVMTGL
jgi:cell division protein FtsB